MLSPTKYYTVGFIFNIQMSHVLLVHKTKPEWQQGKLNGIGGKYEKDENAYDCIVRETTEESTLKTTPKQWEHIGILSWPGKEIHVMTTIYTGTQSDAVQGDYEAVEWFPIDALPTNTLENLNWLIPMSQQALLGHISNFNSCGVE